MGVAGLDGFFGSSFLRQTSSTLIWLTPTFSGWTETSPSKLTSGSSVGDLFVLLLLLGCSTQSLYKHSPMWKTTLDFIHWKFLLWSKFGVQRRMLEENLKLFDQESVFFKCGVPDTLQWVPQKFLSPYIYLYMNLLYWLYIAYERIFVQRDLCAFLDGEFTWPELKGFQWCRTKNLRKSITWLMATQTQVICMDVCSKVLVMEL